MSLKARKKRLFLKVWRPILKGMDVEWHTSTDQEASEIRELIPWASIVTNLDQFDLPVGADAAGDSHDGPARLVFISRICRKKNLKLILEAMNLASAPVEFDIYGPVEDREYWSTCLSLIGRLPDHVRATYRGELPPGEVRRTFSKYDAFIFPTLGENFGHVIAESLSASCPVICSDTTAWTHVLEAGGGSVVRDATPEGLAVEIERLATMSPAERFHARHLAADAYATWRRDITGPNIIEQLRRGRASQTTANVPSRAPKIALVTQGYHTGGGVPTVTRWLHDSLVAAGHSVGIHDLATSRADGLSRRVAKPSTWLRPTLARRCRTEPDVWHWGANAVEIESMRYRPRAELTRALRRYDLIQVVSGGPALAAAVRRTGVPVVMQVATTVAWERKSQLAAEVGAGRLWHHAMTALTSRAERSALRSVDAVLVENAAMLAHVRAVGQCNVVLAPPGVDTYRFTPPPTGWASDGYLLSVCRLGDARKGIDRTIRAYREIVSMDARVPNLVLAGRGSLPRPLVDLIARLGLSARVVIRSDVDRDELVALYQGASVFLLTSHEEGLGMSVLEASSCGLPTVCTDTAGTRESVADGETGWLIPQFSGDEMPAAVAKRVLDVLHGSGEAMSARARDRCVREFSRDATLARFVNTYEGLLR